MNIFLAICLLLCILRLMYLAKFTPIPEEANAVQNRNPEQICHTWGCEHLKEEHTAEGCSVPTCGCQAYSTLFHASMHEIGVSSSARNIQEYIKLLTHVKSGKAKVHHTIVVNCVTTAHTNQEWLELRKSQATLAGLFHACPASIKFINTHEDDCV